LIQESRWFDNLKIWVSRNSQRRRWQSRSRYIISWATRKWCLLGPGKESVIGIVDLASSCTMAHHGMENQLEICMLTESDLCRNTHAEVAHALEAVDDRAGLFRRSVSITHCKSLTGVTCPSRASLVASQSVALSSSSNMAFSISIYLLCRVTSSTTLMSARPGT